MFAPYASLFVQAWDMYNGERLVELVDPVLSKGANEWLRVEAVRFIKVGLLCVQETTKLRPKMSAVIKMLTGEANVDGVKISQPGFVADLMDVKIEKKKESQSL